jgi:tRNA dimethylallyltransferase
MKAIGYREFFVEKSPGVWGISGDLEGVQTLVARNSRRYAKRQLTFFSSLPGLKWVSVHADPVGEIRRELEGFL